jgi:hypothetical protein
MARFFLPVEPRFIPRLSAAMMPGRNKPFPAGKIVRNVQRDGDGGPRETTPQEFPSSVRGTTSSSTLFDHLKGEFADVRPFYFL